MLKPHETRSRVLIYIYLNPYVWWKPWTWRGKLQEHIDLLTEREYKERLYKYARERYDREFPGEEEKDEIPYNPGLTKHSISFCPHCKRTTYIMLVEQTRIYICHNCDGEWGVGEWHELMKKNKKDEPNDQL